MLPRIETIKQIRTRLGMTQKEIAVMSGVSTSMINQIESGRSKPSYETAKRIFDNLTTLEGRLSSHKAGEFCSKDIITLKPSNTLHDAIQTMQKFSISQIPVFDGKVPVGVITEDSIMTHLANRGERELKKAKLMQAMEAVPPVVNHETPVNALVPLIRFTKCILVSKDSSIMGIITASDTLRIMES